jgi:hypothetical protein
MILGIDRAVHVLDFGRRRGIAFFAVVTPATIQEIAATYPRLSATPGDPTCDFSEYFSALTLSIGTADPVFHRSPPAKILTQKIS